MHLLTPTWSELLAYALAGRKMVPCFARRFEEAALQNSLREEAGGPLLGYLLGVNCLRLCRLGGDGAVLRTAFCQYLGYTSTVM